MKRTFYDGLKRRCVRANLWAVFCLSVAGTLGSLALLRSENGLLALALSLFFGSLTFEHSQLGWLNCSRSFLSLDPPQSMVVLPRRDYNSYRAWILLWSTTALLWACLSLATSQERSVLHVIEMWGSAVGASFCGCAACSFFLNHMLARPCLVFTENALRIRKIVSSVEVPWAAICEIKTGGMTEALCVVRVVYRSPPADAGAPRAGDAPARVVLFLNAFEGTNEQLLTCLDKWRRFAIQGQQGKIQEAPAA